MMIPTAIDHRPDPHRVSSRCRIDCTCGWRGPLVSTYGEAHQPWAAHFYEHEMVA